MFSCPFLKKAPAAFFQKEQQTLLTTALRCPFAQRLLSQLPAQPVRAMQTAAAAATEKCERPYPPVCEDGELWSQLAQRTDPLFLAGLLLSVKFSSPLRLFTVQFLKLNLGASKIPTTCALFPCSNHDAPRPIYANAVSSPSAATSVHKTPGSKRKFFDFDEFFADQIDKKRSTSTYRVFRRILRDANEYPFADEFSNDERRRITVWCSNDYLGMSRHPKVQESARWASSYTVSQPGA
ncbi:unnamed protein product [Dibothriocephalus latus]|uniref:5-aminolevulinate synthase presequence domain-containing protein n=1 Tax=Dibothriocephalus latus TaxID=60516 RepID=A0A3P7L1H8_DIBLA|nr:unnamed protein product [Dibothriocephalus latus]